MPLLLSIIGQICAECGWQGVNRTAWGHAIVAWIYVVGVIAVFLIYDLEVTSMPQSVVPWLMLGLGVGLPWLLPMIWKTNTCPGCGASIRVPYWRLRQVRSIWWPFR